MQPKHTEVFPFSGLKLVPQLLGHRLSSVTPMMTRPARLGYPTFGAMPVPKHQDTP